MALFSSMVLHRSEKVNPKTVPGKGATYTCRWCGHVSGGEEIPATRHSWGNAVLNTDDGKYYHICSKCSAVEETDAPNNE